MQQLKWTITHKPTSMTLSGRYTAVRDESVLLKQFMRTMLDDFQQFMGYGNDADYETELTKQGEPGGA